MAHAAAKLPQKNRPNSSRQETLRLLRSFFASCSSTCCLPYRFNQSRGFHLTESKWELFLWKLNSLTCFFNAAFVVSRMIQFNLDSSAPISMQLYLRLMAPIHSIAFLVVQIPTFKSCHSIVNLAAQTEKFFANGELENALSLGL